MTLGLGVSGSFVDRKFVEISWFRVWFRGQTHKLRACFAHTALADMSADVLVPPTVEKFSMGTITRCTNCAVTTTPTLGTVNVIRAPAP